MKNNSFIHIKKILKLRSSMSEESKNAPSPSKVKGITPQESVDLPFHWFMLAFFIIYIVSFFIPLLIFFLYIVYIFIPIFLEAGSFFSLFTDFEPLIVSLLTPFVMIGCYLLHLLFLAWITRYLWAITEKKSPSKDGVIPRNVRSKTLNFYHIRSFMIKYGKTTFVKDPFP